jgi:hypothetical protein
MRKHEIGCCIDRIYLSEHANNTFKAQTDIINAWDWVFKKERKKEKKCLGFKVHITFLQGSSLFIKEKGERERKKKEKEYDP